MEKDKDFKKNTVYIPGWVDRASFYPCFRGLEIWDKDIDPKERIDAKYVVAHSLGTHFALMNWDKNKNTKLILINPLIIKKPIRYWMAKWMEYFAREGKGHLDSKRASLLKSPLELFEKTKHLLQDDFFKILDKIPPEDITIIRGSEDRFFCDADLESLLREKGIPVVVIEGMGHLWNEKVYELLPEIIRD